MKFSFDPCAVVGIAAPGTEEIQLLVGKGQMYVPAVDGFPVQAGDDVAFRLDADVPGRHHPDQLRRQRAVAAIGIGTEQSREFQAADVFHQNGV